MRLNRIGFIPLLLIHAPAQQPLVLKTTTKLVQVSALVHDKSGKPVSGLTQDDFILKVDGKPHPIRFFSQDDYGALPNPSQALPPNTFTNPSRHSLECHHH